MKSMTGYGRNRYTDDIHEIEVEIKSVNNRFLDASFRMPRELSYLEAELKDLLNKKLKRGKVSININYKSFQSNQLELNEDNLKSYWNLYKKAAEIVGEDSRIPLVNILSEPNVITLKEAERVFDESETGVVPLLKRLMPTNPTKQVEQYEKLSRVSLEESLAK